MDLGLELARVEERHEDDFVILLYSAAEHKDRLVDNVVPIGLVDPEEFCGAPPSEKV